MELRDATPYIISAISIAANLVVTLGMNTHSSKASKDEVAALKLELTNLKNEIKEKNRETKTDMQLAMSQYNQFLSSNHELEIEMVKADGRINALHKDAQAAANNADVAAAITNGVAKLIDAIKRG